MSFMKSVFAGFVACVAFTGMALAADAPVVYREFIEGNAKAKVTVIEYASLTCPHCAEFHVQHYPKLKADYIDKGKIKFIYRDLPGDGLALGAAMLARCAPGDRGKTMVDLLFKNQREWATSPDPKAALMGFAQLAGMNATQVEACLANEAVFKDIQDVRTKALSLYKIEGTPTFFVNDEPVKGGDYELLKAAIDKQAK